MRILITGSNGFIGKHLIAMLSKSGHDIIMVDLQNDIDITKWEDVENITKCEIVYHLAAKSYVPDSFQNPESFYYTNIIGTLNILKYCRINNSKLVFLSSYVYGTPEYLPVNEDHPIKSLNPYSQSKIICENICEAYNRDFNVPVAIIRPFNIYGFGQRPEFLIPKLITQFKSENKEVVIDNTITKRDFIHIHDVCSALVGFLKCEYSLDVFNLSSGQSISIKDIIQILHQLTGERKFIQDLNTVREGEVFETIGDNSKLMRKLSWRPVITFHEGITDLYKVYEA
jgi:nucleoside-diphosphate-sugar epimerase